MWKLVDCGTYPWFVMEKQKYFHCIHATTGEYKKLKVKRKEMPMYMMTYRAYLAYLKTWPLATSPCRLDKKTAKFYINHWKNKTKTKRIKEILKQLRAI
jgi:hypothetical protein|tara:strand:+ start:510 stop:806 length:297 start_codon:yes stop_codon:yes gene_type:complete